MPGFDRSGPVGRGPATGGARGRCNSAGPAGYGGEFGGSAGRGRGRASGRGQRGCNGSGRGAGRGAGRGYAFVAQGDGQNSDDELTALKRRSDSLKNTLNAMKSRIAELEETE